MQDWVRARDAYRSAVFLTPDDPVHHFNVGVCVWNMVHLGERDDRAEAYAEAARSLEHARALNERAGTRPAGEEFPRQTHYYLGRIYTDSNQMTRAIPHLRVVALSAADEPLAKLFLGQAYRFSDNLDAARQYLREGIAAVDPGAAVIGASMGDPWPRELVLAWLYEQLAEVESRRDGDQNAITRAVAQARAHAGALAGDVADAVLGSCRAVEGELLLRGGELDGAIVALHEALALRVDPAFYTTLASAYTARLRDLDADRWDTVMARARAAAEQALRLDVNGRSREEIDRIRARLDQLAQQAPAPPGLTSPSR